MTYQLGLDLGTTSVAAAILRAGAPDPEVVPLGGSGATVPAVLHLARDGGVTVGDGASRRAGLDPGRVVRALKRRMGDPTPIIVGGESWTAEELSARMVRWVVDRVAEQEGEPAAGIALAHPAPWSAAVLDRLATALTDQDVTATFVPEPVAVACAARRELTDGGPERVAVYALGGGRFDAAVLHRGDGGAFTLRGCPEGLVDIGGLAFDDLLWEHVRTTLPDDVVLDARVRRTVVRAKETLSTKFSVTVRVKQGERAGEVRVERGTFEQLITPSLDRTIVVLQRVLGSAEVAPAELDAILLVGGSSRIPLVARTVSARLGRPVTVLDGVGHLVACGAARAAAGTGPVGREQGATAGAPGRPGGPAPAGVEPAAPAPVAAEVSTPAAAEERVCDLDAPTVAFPVPASVDATTPYGTPAVTPTAVTPEETAPAPAAAGSTGVGRQGGPAGTGREQGDPAGIPAPTPDAPTPPDPQRRLASVARPAARVPAVLEPAPRRDRTRSLPRLLVGAGAVVVAALVLVALFRPDGPLDPPLDPVGTDATRVTGAPAVPAPVPTTGTPAAEGVRDGAAADRSRVDDPAPGLRVDDPADGVSLDDAAAAFGPVRARASAARAVLDAADAGRPAVDTTPPPPPTVRTTGVGPVPRSDGSGGIPVGAAPRTPPTPAAPAA